MLILLPILLPPYVLSYSWRMLLSPSMALGLYVSGRPALAEAANLLTTWTVLLLWHWPVAAIILAQGWRRVDPSVLEMASLEAGAARRFAGVVLPLLAGPIALAFGACFVLSLGEYTTFHLAGVRTIGTEIDTLFRLGRDEHLTARAAWPMAGLALAVAVALWRGSARPLPQAGAGEEGPAAALAGPAGWRGRWVVLGGLLAISCAVPLVLLILFLSEPARFRQFGALHWDQIQWSLLVAGAAGLLSLWIARTAAALGRPAHGAAGARPSRAASGLAAAMQISILFLMFLPASLPAVALLKMMAALDLPAPLRNGWLPLAAGLCQRYAGLAVIVLWFARRSEDPQLAELSAVDGASPFRAWLHVHLPRHWPLPVGALVMIVLFGLTEVPATMLLLPPGLPCLSQWLLDQMHHLRDQHVVVACLALMGAYFLLAGGAGVLLRLAWARGAKLACVAAVLCLTLAGCGEETAGPRAAKVLGAFGRTGSGHGEFLYPRAIAMAPDGSLVVIDKTGRVQWFSAEGKFLSAFAMPQGQAGKPTGLAVAPDGTLWVADTHYHRVLVFTPEGKLLREIGRMGREPGCFLYPTHVAFAPDGRVFVSEYGGNDRISVFQPDGNFLASFGSPGEGDGQFSRPSAMAVDASRGRLYVADACNHRVATYDLSGRLRGYFGSAGVAPGQLRYPYGLSLMADGKLAVCEFGNNRVQVFSPDGRSLGIYGGAGRELGQLAYPWALAAGAGSRVYVVDAGNNRVQLWQL